MEPNLYILLAALVLDWFAGEPNIIWSRITHPVVLLGKSIGFVEKRFNRSEYTDVQRYKYGAASVSICIIGAVLAGVLLEWLLSAFVVFGAGIEIFIVFVLLAQRSLYDHVQAISTGFETSGLEGARDAVGLIVGRNPQSLDETGIVRAGIESLAENFSDGVVAPAFWYVIFGLPGLLAYKMINTADSMIGYRNDRYEWFGKAAAQIDDLANWLPARLSVLFIALAGWVCRGWRSGVDAFICAVRDSGLHASPNAGWPEGAMAGALGVALGGPRDYGEIKVRQSYINAAGDRKLNIGHISAALKVFSLACYSLWFIVLLLAIVL